MASRHDATIQAFREALASLEKQRKSRLVAFIQDDDDHICRPALDAVIGMRDKIKRTDKLEIIVHSNGGHVEIAYQMANFFRSRCEQLNMLVPIRAKSAATLLCLGADRIYMGEFSELGPLDVQINDPLEKGAVPFSPLDEFKSMEYLEEYAAEVLDVFTSLIIDRSGMGVKQALHEAIPAVAQMMTPLYGKVDPSKVGGYRRSLAIGEEYAKRLLQSAGRRDLEELTEKLVWSYPSHDFVINRKEARNMGLPVEDLDTGQERLLLKHLKEIQRLGVSLCAISEPTVEKKERTRKRPVPLPEVAPKVTGAAAG